MHFHLNGVQISEVPKFLADSPSEITHDIQLVIPLNGAHPLILHLQLHGVTSYFDVLSPSIAEHLNEKILMIF